MAGMTSAPNFTTRVPIQFLVPDNTSLNITGATALFNNPRTFYVQPGSVAKIDMGINGTTYFRGDGEYAPFALEMTWAQLGYTDYLALAALRQYFCHFVSFRNLGYYGKLVLDGPKSDQTKVSDVVSTKAIFYVLAPSDQGGAATINRLPVPSTPSVSQGSAGSGYIPTSVTNYYWLTYSSIWGETTPVAFSQTSSAASVNNLISWSWPTSSFCTKASLYVSYTNSSSTAKLLAEVINGEAGGPQFTDYVGYPGCVVTQTPPTTTNGACRGTWQSGIWSNETP